MAAEEDTAAVAVVAARAVMVVMADLAVHQELLVLTVAASAELEAVLELVEQVATALVEQLQVRLVEEEPVEVRSCNGLQRGDRAASRRYRINC